MAQPVIKSLASGKEDILLIPVEKLVVEEGFNIREDYGDIEGLARELAAAGQKQPLRVRLSTDKKSAVIIDGHRRLKAVPIANKSYGAKITALKCIVEEKGANEETRIIDLFMLGDGKPLTPIEQAAAIKRLLGFNKKPAEIARMIGKSVNHIDRLLKLNSASAPLREAVRKGTISASAVMRLSEAPEKVQAKFVQKIVDAETRPVPEAKKEEVKGKAKSAKPAKPASKPKNTVKVTDVEKEIQGHATMISAKAIKTLIEKIDGYIKANRSPMQWKWVRYGLELALGVKVLEEEPKIE